MSSRTPTFLLVEDNPDHAELVKEIFSLDPDSGSIDHVESGEDALLFLHRAAPFTEKPLPDVVLLDLNLPGMSGLEVLQQIKEDSILRVIPVVMITSSNADRDRVAAYHRWVNSYVLKSINAEDMQQTLGQIQRYWGSVNQPPGNVQRS